jgi:hypothetical protein
MPNKHISLRYKKERCVPSDVLPYEVPISFTNRHFYDFLHENRVEFSGDCLSWKAGNAAVDALIHLLFSIPQNTNRLKNELRQVGSKSINFQVYNVYGRGPSGPRPGPLIPFKFKIDHKEDEFRDLALPHPRSQVEMVHFYDRYKETILYFSSRSSFSMRRPSKVASFIFHKDRTHYDKLGTQEVIIEQRDEEYEHLKSFFVYKEYSNVFRFYESYRYHRCEKKFTSLLKLDIAKCFDSIYTHSIAWAILGKDAVKENIPASSDTFAGRFDRLMQRLNYNETNGIIIGPEFSRIFAELLLQSIDRRLERELLHAEPPLRHKVDYEILRYVDDFFVFFNEPEDKRRIVEQLQHLLKEFNLHLNSAKAILYEKPIITEISRAKRQIANLLQEKLKYDLETIEDEATSEKLTKGSIYVDAQSLIIQFKTIIKVCGVQYKDLLNYSLSIVENKLDLILRDYTKASPAHRSQRELTNALLGILQFVFFIYSVSPKVNSTIKLCRVLRIVCSYFRSRDMAYEHKHMLFKYVFDDIMLILRKSKNAIYTQIETLYLLIAIAELGKEYRLEQDVLASYFGITRDPQGDYSHCVHLNYFSLTVLLFYMGHKDRYRELRACVDKAILAKFTEWIAAGTNDSEAVLLLFDTLSCPYVTRATKLKLLELHGIVDPTLASDMLDYRMKGRTSQQWFTTWFNFDFGRELDRKKGFEVY